MIRGAVLLIVIDAPCEVGRLRCREPIARSLADQVAQLEDGVCLPGRLTASRRTERGPLHHPLQPPRFCSHTKVAGASRRTSSARITGRGAGPSTTIQHGRRSAIAADLAVGDEQQGVLVGRRLTVASVTEIKEKNSRSKGMPCDHKFGGQSRRDSSTVITASVLTL